MKSDSGHSESQNTNGSGIWSEILRIAKWYFFLLQVAWNHSFNQRCINEQSLSWVFFSRKGHSIWHQYLYSITLSNETTVQSPACYRTHPCVQMQFGMTLENDEFAWELVLSGISFWGIGNSKMERVSKIWCTIESFSKPCIFYFSKICRCSTTALVWLMLGSVGTSPNNNSSNNKNP